MLEDQIGLFHYSLFRYQSIYFVDHVLCKMYKHAIDMVSSNICAQGCYFPRLYCPQANNWLHLGAVPKTCGGATTGSILVAKLDSYGLEESLGLKCIVRRTINRGVSVKVRSQIFPA
jgi:hypothetical protein